MNHYSLDGVEREVGSGLSGRVELDPHGHGELGGSAESGRIMEFKISCDLTTRPRWLL